MTTYRTRDLRPLNQSRLKNWQTILLHFLIEKLLQIPKVPKILDTWLPAIFQNLAALQFMNLYCRLIINLEYLCKILINHISWIYFINVLLCSDFSRLVGNGGSIYYRDIRDLWSVYYTNSCIEVPQDSKKMLVT